MIKKLKSKAVLTLLCTILSLTMLSSCEFLKINESKPEESTQSEDSQGEVSVDVSEDDRPALQWPLENSFVSILPPFNGGKIVEIEQKPNSVVLHITNVERSAFELYITALKQMSFTDVTFENDDIYSAIKTDSAQGKTEGVTVRYYNESSTMTIDVSIETSQS